MEEYQARLGEVEKAHSGMKLDELLDVVRSAFPDDEDVVTAIEVALSVTAALCVNGLEGCPAVLLEGPAGSRKTTVLRLLPTGDLSGDVGEVFYSTDQFTPAAFVSHMADKTEEELEKIDMLRRIAQKVMVVSDMGVLFSERKEKLLENLGVLTKVLDGQGYKRDSGAHGQRGLVGDYKFGFLGATTPLSQAAWDGMASLGSRLLVLGMGRETPGQDDLVAMLQDEVPFETKVNAVRQGVRQFIAELLENSGGYGAVDWGRDADAMVEAIVARARVTAHLRSTIEPDEHGEPQVSSENPIRLATSLRAIARGHALLDGRSFITVEDLPIVTRLAMDTGPFRRRAVFRQLVALGDIGVTTRDVESAADCSTNTALDVMDDLVTLGLAEKLSTPKPESFKGHHEPRRIVLAGEWRWLWDDVRDEETQISAPAA